LQNETSTNQIEPRIWNTWSTVGLSIVIFIIFSTIQVITHLIVAVLNLSPLSSASIRDLLESLSTDGLAISISTIVAAPVGILMTFLFIKMRRGLSVSEYLGLKSFSKKTLPWLLLIPIGLTAIVELVSIFVAEPEDSGFMMEAYKNSVFPALFWISVVIFAPAFEEVLFRGFIFKGLMRSRIGSAGTVILTSLVWSLFHFQYNLSGIALVFIIGLILGVVRTKTGSLWGPLIIHSIWNLLQMLLLVLYLNVPQ